MIEEDAEIQKLLAKIKQTQDQMQEALKQKQMSNYQNLKKELAQYRFIFEKHPLLQNYLQYKKDVEQILQEVISVLKREMDYWHNAVGLAEVSEETMDVIRAVARKSYNLVK